MVFYFSGTGNSLYAAKKIGEAIGESVLDIASAIHKGTFEFPITSAQTIGFVFPLYAWSAPEMVFDFISHLKLDGHYVFAAATYGQNIGRFDKFFEKAGIRLNSAFSINMPNNYIYVWDQEKQQRCLEAADRRIALIREKIRNRENIIDIHCELNGRHVPEAMTAFAPRMNAQWSQTLRDVSEFYVTDACVGCGLCAKVCNGDAIRIVDGKPLWGNTCTKCLACLHLCPQQAIQFGEYTSGSGRYKNPNISVKELIKNP